MVIDIGKIYDLVKDPDLKIKINDLYGENIKLKEENYSLKKRIDKLEEISNVKSKLIHEDNHYFVKEKEIKDGPYCTKCWDSDNKLIRLHQGEHHSGQDHYSCPNCKTYTSTGTYIPDNQPGGTHWDF